MSPGPRMAHQHASDEDNVACKFDNFVPVTAIDRVVGAGYTPVRSDGRHPGKIVFGIFAAWPNRSDHSFRSTPLPGSQWREREAGPVGTISSSR